VLNKPKGCICSTSDEKKRLTVLDLIGPKIKERIYPVGRLDYNTTGCLFLTNDGDWANRIIHPKHEVEKEYIVKIKGNFNQGVVEKLKKGIYIEGKRLFAKNIRLIKKLEKNYIVSVIITQGINHQIKKMFSYVGLTVLRLKRERVGTVTIKGLQPGQWRYLTGKEIEAFNKF
ncbi:MAG: pseudouridine synthase, partial [Candidatus Goldbacteria bacterium]|nr:pseudouridine synthase [Candidatus Goldiibacteriota bacterium]